MIVLDTHVLLWWTTTPHLLSTRDPMDCLIAGTALTHGVPLVTKDERIQRSGVVATIW